MNTTIVIYSHTENNDIWEYIQQSIADIDKKHRKIIAIESEGYETTLSGFDKVVVYTDSWTYDKKLLHIFNAVDTEYMVLIHDNDLITTFDNVLLDDLLSKCKTHNIDRCMFGVVARDAPLCVELIDGHRIGKINNITTPHFYTPYDVGPSIWKVESYKSALKTAPNTHYRDIELSAVKQFCINNLNIYAFLSHPTEKSYYVIGRPFYHKFQFLHIFVRRQLLELHLYMDQKDNLIRILNTYPDITRRGVLLNQNHINIHFRSV